MGIKSFQAAKVAPVKSQDIQISVSDYMTKDLISFHPEQSVLEVMESLIQHRISGGPVINDQKQLVGMISEADCMKQISMSRYFNLPMNELQVSEYMSKEVQTLDANLNIFDAANFFVTSKRRRFPVLESGKLVGQISRKDILKAALKLQAQNWDYKKAN